MGKKVSLKGIIKNTIKTINNAHLGDNMYLFKLEKLGITISFENNLIASLNGWQIPISLTLLGPFRI